MRRHALVVGINRYDHLQGLKLPAGDAEAIAQRLQTGGVITKIDRLPEGIRDGHPVVDPDRRVTAAELEEAIARLFKPDGDDYPDLALLFVAGHGHRKRRGIVEGFLAVSDSNPDANHFGLSLKWLRELLRASPVRNQIVWLDTCHSGELLNFQEADPGSGSRCLIAASRSFEVAYEEIAGHHGVLTNALLKGLDPATRPDGIVTHLALADVVTTALKGETQHPLVANSGEPIELARGIAETPPLAQPTGRCPYKGLRYFDRNDVDPDDFFGRQALTDELLERVRTDDFLAVVGVSGSGKSSVVRAGLLHALQQGERIGGSAAWPQVIMLPGSDPLASLVAELLRETDADPADLLPLTNTPDPAALAHIATTLAAPKPHTPDENDPSHGTTAGPLSPRERGWGEGRLILLIDQFEELFTQTDAHKREAFLALLLGALDQAQGRLCLIITLRADFYAKCAEQEYSGLARRIQDHQITLLPMATEALREAIVAPARGVGLEIDEALVAELLAQLQEQPGHLPLLEDTLTELWQQGHADGRLTLAEYRTLGGLHGTLARRADALFEQGLDTEAQAAARWILIELTRLGEGTEDTRRRVPQADLVTPRFDQALIDATVAKLADARLVVTSSLLPRGVDQALGPAATVATVEVAHEALIRHWPTLRAWLDKDRDFQTWLRRLRAEAREWAEERREPMTGAELALAEEQRARAEGLLDDPSSRFIEASIAKRAEEQRLDEERRERERQAAQQRRDERRQAEEALKEQERKAEEARRTQAHKAEVERQLARVFWARLVTGISILGVVVAAGLGIWAAAERSQTKMVEELRTAELFESQITHASLLARGEDYAGARRVLTDSSQLDAEIPSERRHARNLLAGYVALRGGRADKVYTGAEAALSGGVAVSLDGRWLAAAGERGTLVLFDAESGEPVRRLEGHDPEAESLGVVRSVVFDPEGRWLFSGGDDRRIIRWSLPDGEKQAEWEAPDRVFALAISPDSGTMASGGGDATITLWDPETGEQRRTLEGHTGPIAQGDSLAFTTDGSRLASASFDETARIWSLESGESLHTLEWHNDRVQAVAFSPDGPLVATASNDKRIVIWNAETGRPLRLLAGHDNIVFDVAFSADGRQLLSASRDNTMRLWDVASGTTLRVYQGHEAALWSVARHGATLYTAANDGTVRRWSLTTPEQWVWEVGRSPEAVAVAPRGDFLALGFGDGSMRVYSIPRIGQRGGILPSEEREGGQTVPDGSPTLLPDAHRTNVNRLAFSPDGRFLASASHDDTAKLWRLEREGEALSLTLLHTLEGHTDSVHDVAFSPDGRTLATAAYDGQVGLFDVETGEGPPFEAHEGRIGSVSFDEGGERLLTSGILDFRLRLWDLTSDPPALAQELPRAQDRLLWATLRPDGRQLAAVGRGSNVTLHDLGPDPAPPRRLVGHEQAVLRAIYSPDGRQLATVSSDMTVRLWDLTTESELFALRLPTQRDHGVPLWDFDFRCTPDGHCWIAVPLTLGLLALYHLPYAHLPPDFTADLNP